jgi:hypothetical protein
VVIFGGIMAILLRWTILVISFCFIALIYAISKEIFPPNIIVGMIRGGLLVFFMFFIWDKTKNIGEKGKYYNNSKKLEFQVSSNKEMTKDENESPKNIKEKLIIYPNSNPSNILKNDITVNKNELYEQIWREIEENKTDIGLWAKCFASCEGDENKTKALYVNKRVVDLKTDLEKQFIEKQRKERKKNEKEATLKMSILEGRADSIEEFRDALEGMPDFFPKILDQYGYSLVQNENRPEMWSINFPNDTGTRHVYNLYDLRLEIIKIVEDNNKLTTGVANKV